jgi:hypothetical protein
MKKNFFLVLFLSALAIVSFAQTIKYDPTSKTFSVDTIGRDYPVGGIGGVSVNPAAKKSLSAIQNTSKQTIFWFEAGDGFFTSDPLTSHAVSTSQKYNPLMLAINLYDTNGHPPPTSLIYNNTKLGVTNTPPVSFTQKFISQGVKITPSVYDIKPGDTMVFALTYRTFKNEIVDPNPSAKVDSGQKKIIDSTFKLYFFYNNNSIFKPITKIETLGNIPIDNVRYHFEETPTFNGSIPINVSTLARKWGFSNSICYNIPNNLEIEKTVFISLVPPDTVATGKSGSFYAVLTDASNKVIAADTIENMLVAPAHDPNYLVQRPVCLLYGKNKSKKEYPFEYKVHFQNTGAGNAIEAKVVIHLPKGMNWNSLKNIKASFAGKDYTDVFKGNKNFLKDMINNTVTFNFKHDALGSSNMLLGTSSCEDPYINPLTMGEIMFSIKSTPNTEDSLKAYAEIFFKSEHPSKYAETSVNNYEEPVKTDTAVTMYKECCTCGPEPIPTKGCYKPFGLCWWWWVLILLAIIITWWLLAKKKKSKETNLYMPTDNQC